MKTEKQIISHIYRNERTGEYVIQSNDEHLNNVAKLASLYAKEFGMEELGKIMGLLHDKGKEKQQFQAYIQDVNGIPGHKNYTYNGKNHAYVGGLIAKKVF